MGKFLDVFEDVTKKGKKIPTDEYLEDGLYPIIDQGQSFISGYRNEEDGLFSDVPAIIFGDHTRIIKYVDKPFFLGADGVKLLKAKEKNINYKYLYYALCSAKIPDTGYNRHYKWLKEIDIPIPSKEEQQKIAATLDKVTDIINLRKKELEKLDLLVKSRFVEMFGDPVANPKGWERNQLKDLSLKIGSGATPKGGRECYGIEGISLIRSMNVHNGIFEYKELAHISDEQAIKLDNVIVKENDVLLNITGASVARSCVVPNDVLPARVNQHVCIIRCNDLILPCFLNNLLINNRFQSLLWSIAGSGATREAITKQQVEKLQIIIPPIDLQNQFAAFVTKTDKSKYAVKKSLEKLETLKKALMQEYFG